MKRFPVITLSVLALAIAALRADLASALVYDRNRILSGELWRIVTCNWVHFSMSHFAYDALGFGVAGSLIELRGVTGFGWFCLLATALIGSVVFLTQSDLQIFGGLSGIATGAIVFLSLHGLRERTAWRWVCLLALVAIAVKMGFEFATGQLAFAQSESILIKVVPQSHLAGALAAVLVWWAKRPALANSRIPHCLGWRGNLE